MDSFKIVKNARERQSRQEGQRQKLGKIELSSQGCICPPTSERTCKNPKCPRQDHRTLGQRMRSSNIG